MLTHLEVAKRHAPFQHDLDRLDSIPGIARRTVEQILAEGVPTVFYTCQMKSYVFLAFPPKSTRMLNIHP